MRAVRRARRQGALERQRQRARRLLPVGPSRRPGCASARRARLLNVVLKHYGVVVSDWSGNAYLLTSLTGRTAIVETISEIWSAARTARRTHSAIRSTRAIWRRSPTARARRKHDDKLRRPYRGQHHHRLSRQRQRPRCCSVCCARRSCPTFSSSSTSSARSASTIICCRASPKARCCWKTAASAARCAAICREALREQLSRRTRGEVPHFRRVVIETSGLADPAPIAYTLLSEAVLRHHFRLSGIVTTVDAVNGAAQIGGFPEAAKQVAMADRLVLTKTDLCDGQLVAAARSGCGALNVSAHILDSSEIGGALHRLLTDDIYDAEGKFREASHWTAEEIGEHAHGPHDHTEAVQSFVVTFDRPWIGRRSASGRACCCTAHGADVLRLKGLLNVAGVPTPVLINGVQHIVHPPSHLEQWPDADSALASHLHRARPAARAHRALTCRVQRSRQCRRRPRAGADSAARARDGEAGIERGLRCVVASRVSAPRGGCALRAPAGAQGAHGIVQQIEDHRRG